MKPCPACLKTLPLTSFPRNRAKPDGLGSQCKDCKRIGQARWYERHGERHRRNVSANNRAQRAALRKIVGDHLAIHPCVDCGEADPVVLEFDHVRGHKVAPVARLAYQNIGARHLLEEIAKCEVRCANCHRRRHARERAATPETANRMQTEAPDAP